MIEIPPESGNPLIQVYPNSEELFKATGQKVCHGFFDASANKIVATQDSIAHEIGHFKDFQSGRMKATSTIHDPNDRIAAKIRNEVVAIVFSYQKLGDVGVSMSYEMNFLVWLEFMRREGKFGPVPTKKLFDLKFSEIQDLADWLCLPSQSWFERLQFLFRQYLSIEDLLS